MPYRQYATKYTKTLNMPVTKFPNFVKKTQRPKHDELIREVGTLIGQMDLKQQVESSDSKT